MYCWIYIAYWNNKYICTIDTLLNTCLMSIPRFALRDKVTFQLLTKDISIADLTEWSQAPNTMIGNWRCSVSIVRVQFSSRDTETLSAHTSNCNTVGLACYTYIGIYIYNYLGISSIFQSAEQESEVFLTHQWLDVTNSTNKNKKQNKRKKPNEKPFDAYGRGDYISQYSSIMFTLVYSTRLCNLISTTR